MKKVLLFILLPFLINGVNAGENTSTAESAFKGKNLVTFGNSITYAENSWAYQTYQRLEFGNLYNGAVGGAIWSKRARIDQNGKSITTQNYLDPNFAGVTNDANSSPEVFQKIINNCATVHIQQYLAERKKEIIPDYVILSYGTNDLSDDSVVGDVEAVMQEEDLNKVNTFTMVGAIRWCVDTLRTEFPDVKIYVALPIQAKSESKNQGNLKKMAAIRKICDALSVSYFDCYAESGITQENEKTYLRDGLHPNESGKYVHGTYIINKLKETVNENSAAKLTSLVLDAGTLSPDFNPAITTYTCYFPAGTNSITPVVSYQGSSITNVETVDVSTGSGSATITVTAKAGNTTTYTINFVKNNNVDYTNLIVNNDFELAPSGTDCSVSVPVGPGIDGWVNNAWRPKEATCKQIYGWTWDLDFDAMGNNSQGINTNPTGNKHGEWTCWISGTKPLPNELHEFYQTIRKDAIPAGTYQLQCMFGVQHSKITTQRLFANNNVQYHGNKEQYVSNLTNGEHNTFAGHSSGENNLRDMVVYTTIGKSDSLKIGIRTGNKKSDGTSTINENSMWGWFKMDYFRLTRIDPVIATDADLANLTIDAGVLDFSPSTTTYNVTLPEGTKTVAAIPTANMQGANISGWGAIDTSSGSATSKIVVTAFDGITTKTYTINYKVETGTGIQEINTNVDYYIDGRKLTVQGVDSYTVYAINGVKIADVKANASQASIDLIPGAYIVKAQNADTFKVIVQ